MTRTIDESINNADLLVQPANDFFSVNATGAPDGSPCLVTSVGDSRAFGAAPTLSPNLMKQAGQGPWAVTFWFRTTNIENAKNWQFGLKGSSDSPIVVTILTHVSGLSNVNFSYLGNTTVNFSIGTPTNTSWQFFAINVPAPGGTMKWWSNNNVGFGNGSVVPAGTSNYSASQNFYIGGVTSSANTLTNDKQSCKIAFHNHALTLTEIYTLYLAMTT